MATLETQGMFPHFDRSGHVGSRATHYCAGCGHGIVHKLLSEAYTELGLQDRTVIVNPIGCAVFGYYYWDVGGVSAGHGQAPSMATAISRLRDKAIVVSYQGDGDLAAIGLGHTLQAAARGEHMAVFFVNNSIYGMTGGQMAPTTLIGQKTTTSPLGRNPATDGMPLHMAELIDRLDLPVYVERVSVADTKRIMQAKRAIRKALEIQRDRKGYAFVEILSPCPTSVGKPPLEAAKFVIEKMEKEYPLGCLRDRSAEAPVRPEPAPWKPLAEFFGDDGSEDPVHEAAEVKERHFKFTGFGGQGILSLGLVVADASCDCMLESSAPRASSRACAAARSSAVSARAMSFAQSMEAATAGSEISPERTALLERFMSSLRWRTSPIIGATHRRYASTIRWAQGRMRPCRASRRTDYDTLTSVNTSCG